MIGNNTLESRAIVAPASHVQVYGHCVFLVIRVHGLRIRLHGRDIGSEQSHAFLGAVRLPILVHFKKTFHETTSQ